jgi:hypothetical protein
MCQYRRQCSVAKIATAQSSTVTRPRRPPHASAYIFSTIIAEYRYLAQSIASQYGRRHENFTGDERRPEEMSAEDWFLKL